MADIPDYPTDSTNDTTDQPRRPVGTYIAIGIALIVVLVVLHLTGVVGGA